MGSNSALLADEMGLGKTVQTILAIRFLYENNDIRRALIVTPRSLCTNWINEFQTWAPKLLIRQLPGNSDERNALYTLPLPVLIGSYEQIRLDRDLLVKQKDFDLVVLDEAQRVKDRNSKTSLGCRLIPRKRSWALTGTPLENRPADLFSIFSYVNQSLLYDGAGIREMHEAIQPYFLRRTKSEALPDLPPIVIQDLHLQLFGEQRAAYQSAWFERRTVVGHDQGDMLALITRLKQLCNFHGDSGQSSKMEALELILDSQTENTDKVLVFSQYVETLKWISKQLNLPYKIYHGGMKHEERDAAITWFRETDGPCVFLISLKAGGVGLNLQEASTVVLFDRWWNPAAEDQAVQRAHRFGRDRPLHVIRFLVEHTIEERIESLISQKRELFDQYVEQAENAEPIANSRRLLYKILDLPSPGD